MNIVTTLKNLLLCLIAAFVLSGCSTDKNHPSFDERIMQSYIDTGRIDRYNELKEKYDSRIILWWNKKSDAWGITNTTLWLTSFILPDLPTIFSFGAFMILLMWLGAFGVGGAILSVLAKVGFRIPILGIPAALTGIFVLGMTLILFLRVFEFLWELLLGLF